MSRIIQTGLFPSITGQVADGALTVALHPRAVNGGVGICSSKLTRLAADVIKQNGMTVTRGVTARHLLRSAILRTFPDAHASALATRIRPILKIVLSTGIDPQQLIEHGSPRVRQLGVIAAEYKRSLRERRSIDGEEMLITAAALAQERRPLAIYGYHRARKEEILFIDALAGDGSVLYLPCVADGMFTVNQRWIRFLADRGWEISHDETSPATTGERLAASYAKVSPRQSVDARAYSDIDAEVRSCLAEAKQLVISGVDPREIAFAVRAQEAYAPAIAAVADEYGLPVNITLEMPLSKTVFGGFVELILEAVLKQLAFEPAARLLMHPFGPKMPEGKWTEARVEHYSGVRAWTLVSPEIAALEWADEDLTLSDRADALTNFLKSIKVREKAAPRTRESLAYRAFTEALSELKALDGDHMMSLDGFAAAVGELLADETVPFSPSAAGIAVIEPKNIVGVTYERVFVLGMAEGVFPKTTSEDPVVDFFERRQLAAHGIEFAEAAEVARWEELSFYFTLNAARGNISFSFPKIIDDRETVESPFFKRISEGGITAVAESTIASSPEELRRAYLRSDDALPTDAALTRAKAQHCVERRRENTGISDEYDGVIGVPCDPSRRTWSASQLTQIGQCSFRWFAERLLRLKPIDEMELGLDPAMRGTLYHKALEIAIERAKNAPDIRAATLEHIDEAFAEAERDPKVALPDLPNWESERADQIRELKKAIEAPEFITDGSKVVGVEVEFRTDWEGFTFTGSIDRVDDTPDGLIAIDYKTSGTKPLGAKDRSGKLAVDVQIPLYANVALPALYPGGNYGDSAYYSLTKGKILRTEKDGDIEKLTDLVEDVRSLLAEGAFAVDPDHAEAVCKYCELESVCRKGPRLRRKSRAA
ncbi:MAG: PD-(D/E)XK nuclease family protein [Chloracidobacterium sp.]|nr:PD-(D/E)XK nuclease family protein [Chloracidobacterium sp.]